MIRSIFFLISYFVITTVAIPFALVTGIFRFLRLRRLERRYAALVAGLLSRSYLLIGGAKVVVEGGENTDGLRGKSLCVVSNHQGMADIPIIVATMPFTVGFIAKRSLLYFPWVGIMMWAIRCVPIDRASPRSAIKAIDKGVQNIRDGFPMMIFPEGTRSRGNEMGTFKKGSLKLATRAEALILPITLSGTYRLIEEKGRLNPSQVRMRIHPPVPTEGLSRAEIAELPGRLEEVIRAGLPD